MKSHRGGSPERVRFHYCYAEVDRYKGHSLRPRLRAVEDVYVARLAPFVRLCRMSSDTDAVVVS